MKLLDEQILEMPLLLLVRARNHMGNLPYKEAIKTLDTRGSLELVSTM
jgi:hypothetical protein